MTIFFGYYLWQGESFNRQKITQEIKTNIINKEPATTAEKKELSQQVFFLK